MLVEKIKLTENEQIIKLIRKHWFILFSRTVSVIFIALLPIFALIGFAAVESYLPDSKLSAIYSYGAEMTFLLALWVLLNWMMLFHVWTDYYLDVWIVTNRRVVVIDQRGLFNRVIGSFRLERLQDMNIEIKGLIATALNYGTIEAQTAGGSEEEFRTAGLPDPRAIKALIVEAADKLENHYHVHHDATA